MRLMLKFNPICLIRIGDRTNLGVHGAPSAGADSSQTISTKSYWTCLLSPKPSVIQHFVSNWVNRLTLHWRRNVFGKEGGGTRVRDGLREFSGERL